MQLLEFDQSVFLAGLPEAISMDTTGFVYVPTSCQAITVGKKPSVFVVK